MANLPKHNVVDNLTRVTATDPADCKSNVIERIVLIMCIIGMCRIDTARTGIGVKGRERITSPKHGPLETNIHT